MASFLFSGPQSNSLEDPANYSNDAGPGRANDPNASRSRRRSYIHFYRSGHRNVVANATTPYHVAGIGYGNATDDIPWRNPTSGHSGIWLMNNGRATWHDLGIASTTVNPVKA